jgi:glycosyltransferase involved in cell wall biosynthesis
MRQSPLVSVRVITYNHENYIGPCIEGILMQRTTFPFEIIIGEDCSTDRTREIVLNYGRRFPDLIDVATSDTNVGGFRNVLRVQRRCVGKYHAYCEGDDYWVDPLKLQKQVDFMEMHPDCPMCFHDAFRIRYDKSALPDYYFPMALPERLTIQDLIRRRLAVPTASVMARAEIIATLPEWRKDIRYGDLLNRLWFAHHGDLAYLKDIMSVYRIHPGGMMMSNRSLKLHFSSVIDIYQRFDAETAYRYSDLIAEAVKEIDKIYRFERLRQKAGKLAYLLYPGKFIKIRQTKADIIKRFEMMYQR